MIKWNFINLILFDGESVMFGLELKFVLVVNKLYTKDKYSTIYD